MPAVSERVVILDRDGVINEDSDDYIKSLDEWVPLPGSLAAIARLSNAGYRVAIASNQSGLARGLFSLADLLAIHRRLHEAVAAEGGHIEMIAFCPHGPGDGCGCRKPEPGLLTEIGARLGVGLAGVPFIGDSLSDIRAARAVGASPWLVRTGKGERTLRDLTDARHAHLAQDLRVFSNLGAVADALLHPRVDS